MSSIFGKYNFNGPSSIRREMELMMGRLNHWNADDSGIWTSGNVGLGFLALYNTPESVNEKLPLYHSQFRLVITADARIDNREELYSLLEIKTPGEKLAPDSHIILLLYKKYGANCVEHLIGDFAFAIWDEQEQLLFCARDQMGVKPFFYYCDTRFFAFASEKKGLLCLPGTDRSIDGQFFYNQALGPVVQAADTTLYKHIRRLPPAHTLTFYPLKNELRLRNYWTLDAEKEVKLARKDDYYEGLRYHFEEAVRCRLRSSYAVGAQLSGGLDSSAITGVASQLLEKESKHLITFSNVSAEGSGNDNEWRDEREYIDEVNRFNHIEERVLVTKNIWEDVADEVDFCLDANDGLEMWSPAWLMPIKKAAMQRGVRNLLSGFPGDEMVSYRGQFYFLDYLDNREYIKYFKAGSENHFNKVKPFLPSAVEFMGHKARNFLTLNSKENRNIADFFQIEAKYRYSKGDVVWQDINYRERFKSYRHFQKYRLLKPQIALRMEAETRFGLYFKTEPRFPMADIRLAQFYLSIPNELKYGGELSRWLYRNAVAQYLPETIMLRDDKKGNIMPFKSTKEARTQRQLTLLTMLEHFQNKSIYENVIKMKTLAHRYNTNLFLELLRWYEKSFWK